MSHRAERKRDAFTFSLGGLTAVASVFPAPALPHDQIRQSHRGAERGTTQEKTTGRCQPEAEPASAT